ncbi:MAG: HdeA/HdeB family chaperone [Chromatiaceae bacterium]|jgi:hypothetical protein
MFRSLFRLAAAATTLFIVASATSGLALAADERDFSTQSCKDIMRLSGEDREIALAFAHGYVLGKKGTTRYDVDRLAGITDRFIDYCLDNPRTNALQSFERIAE